ncbi:MULTISPECIES: carbohydrate kinase family protein [Cobetia]|uniref:Carbohydrate kinase n=1 Tax=Cobetia crustatorum TaxID=553385 RepID=A0A558HJA5_9GAMM|nr:MULTISPECIES: carbohydrate kinase [Cobetia]TVU69203.1 carbohydrate kinase [Cobetia crustatorum]
MTPVIAFGEALVDMLSNKLGNQSVEQETFTPYAGGAPANVAVACARLGLPSYFVGMLGQDSFGDFLHEELTAHGVRMGYVKRTSEARTALAFVSRDDDGERRFDFYRPPAADLLFRPEHAGPELFATPAIFHLCSNSLTEAPIADTSFVLASRARAAGSIVSVDANLRHNLWPNQQIDVALVTRLLDNADILKLSQEEVDALTQGQEESAWLRARLTAGVRLIVLTDGPGAIRALVRKQSGETQAVSVTPPVVKAVDTTAGGDAFIGGFLSAISEAAINATQLADWCEDDANLQAALSRAAACGAFTVTRPGAYAALPMREDLVNLI